jgi:hypothetical protein
MCDTHFGVVDGDGELIREQTVAALEHKVANVAMYMLRHRAAANRIVHTHKRVDRHTQTNRCRSSQFALLRKPVLRGSSLFSQMDPKCRDGYFPALARAFDRFYDELYGLFFSGPIRIPAHLVAPAASK